MKIILLWDWLARPAFPRATSTRRRLAGARFHKRVSEERSQPGCRRKPAPRAGRSVAVWSSCFLLKDPRDIALAMENADDSDGFFLSPQVVEANILETLDGPRAQSFQAGVSEMPERARLGIPADEFRRLIERQQKPDHEVFTAFSRIILRDSFRILICCWRRDAVQQERTRTPQ